MDLEQGKEKVHIPSYFYFSMEVVIMSTIRMNLGQTNSINVDKTFGKDISSKGMLYKWTGTKNGALIFIKTGMVTRIGCSDIQPITEVLVSDILELFEINYTKYYLDKIERKGKDYTVCYSYDFTKGGEFISMRNLVSRGENDYEIVTNTFPEFIREIDTMLVVDFLINNIDRHYRNFGIVKRDSSYEFAPLFDHGFSLYGDLSDYELELDDKQTLESIDECKTFSSSHYKQLDLIQSNLVFNFSEIDLINILYNYKSLLTPHRIDCIEYLLRVRYRELKKRGFIHE